MAGNSSDEYDGPPAPMTIWGRVLAEGRRVIETPRDELSGQIVEDLILMEKIEQLTINTAEEMQFLVAVRNRLVESCNPDIVIHAASEEERKEMVQIASEAGFNILFLTDGERRRLNKQRKGRHGDGSQGQPGDGSQGQPGDGQGQGQRGRRG